MSSFHPLEVVGRGSDTQFEVGENLNYLILCFNPYSAQIDFRRL